VLIDLFWRIKFSRLPLEDKVFYKHLKSIFGITPNNIAIYKLAIVHKSAPIVLPRGKRINNERLEYLGDAILDAIVADYLFSEYPNQNEGFLTKMRSKIVSRASLNQLALDMGIDKLVVSQSGNGTSQKYIFGNALEALIGAMFVDRGFQLTSSCVIKSILGKYIDLDNLQTVESDFKSRIFEWAQKNRIAIQFQNQESNPNSSYNPHFISSISINDQLIGEGHGSSKKEAEQNAAMEALLKVDEILLITPTGDDL